MASDRHYRMVTLDQTELPVFDMKASILWQWLDYEQGHAENRQKGVYLKITFFFGFSYSIKKKTIFNKTD